MSPRRGQPCKLSATQKIALKAIVEEGPELALDGVVSSDAADVARWVYPTSPLAQSIPNRRRAQSTAFKKIPKEARRR